MTTKRIYSYCIKDDYIFAGDFKLANIDWTSECTTLLKQDSANLLSATSCLFEIYNLVGLKKYINIKTISDNILDLLFSYTIISVNEDNLTLVKENVYHPCLYIKLLNLLTAYFTS